MRALNRGVTVEQRSSAVGLSALMVVNKGVETIHHWKNSRGSEGVPEGGTVKGVSQGTGFDTPAENVRHDAMRSRYGLFSTRRECMQPAKFNVGISRSVSSSFSGCRCVLNRIRNVRASGR